MNRGTGDAQAAAPGSPFRVTRVTRIVTRDVIPAPSNGLPYLSFPAFASSSRSPEIDDAIRSRVLMSASLLPLVRSAAAIAQPIRARLVGGAVNGSGRVNRRHFTPLRASFYLLSPNGSWPRVPAISGIIACPSTVKKFRLAGSNALRITALPSRPSEGIRGRWTMMADSLSDLGGFAWV